VPLTELRKVIVSIAFTVWQSLPYGKMLSGRLQIGESASRTVVSTTEITQAHGVSPSARLTELINESVLRALFDPDKGAGFSAMKTVIASTDFMSAGPFYSYDDVPGDVAMNHFSIARDLGPNGLIAFIKLARLYGKFVLQAPMDYPPDWMLIDVNKNQHVNPQYYDALARYYLRYLQDYEKHGVFVDYLSLFNEPDIYTKIPYNEIDTLLKDHVGPLLKKEGIRTRIMLSEAPNREDAARNYPLVLEDPAARQYVSVAPYHGYDDKDWDKILNLHRQFPALPLWIGRWPSGP
jgi:glucosylceramidase